MSQPNQESLHGEAMERAGQDWDNLSGIFRLIWGLKSECPPLGIRMMAHMSWKTLPDQTKKWLYESWSEAQR